MVDTKQVCCGQATDNQLHHNTFYAESHLASLMQRFNKTPDLKATYEAGIESDIKKGYIRKFFAEEHHKTKWLIPQYGLVNPNKPGEMRKCTAAAKSKRCLP